MRTIGSRLKEVRDSKSMTLRQVEESTGISNAYLSQLENDKIKSPSANVLYKLASLYKVSLNDLLSETDVVSKQQVAENNKISDWSKRIAFSAGDLTEIQKKEVLNYIQYLKSKNV